MATILNNLVVVRASHTVAGDVDEDYTMMRDALAYDLAVLATGAGADTVTLQNGAAAISGAVQPNGDTNHRRPASTAAWTYANAALSTGDTLRFNVSAGNITYEAFAYLMPEAL